MDGDRRRVPHGHRRDPHGAGDQGGRARAAGAIGSPHLLLLSGIGPRRELEAARHRVSRRFAARRQAPEGPRAGRALLSGAGGRRLDGRGRHLVWPRRPARAGGPLPADPGDDARLPAELQALKQEAERRITEWATTGRGLVSRPCTRRARGSPPAWATITPTTRRSGFFACGYNPDIWQRCLRVDTDEYFDDAPRRLAADAESMIVLANPVQPHSEGEIVLESADPADHPDIRMNYFGDPHDMKVMVAVMRRVLDIVAHWPAHRRDRPLADSAVTGPEARARRGRHTERRAARGPRAALFVDRLPPRRRRAASGAWWIRACG